ncbi:hypothetical protein [Streptomyces sp. NPDC058394]|uniref:hypothetical protein n=1 Tax=Streptomyces sp. NPDC058394 TaxID=3346477 RepID=UPI003658303B
MATPTPSPLEDRNPRDIPTVGQYQALLGAVNLRHTEEALAKLTELQKKHTAGGVNDLDLIHEYKRLKVSEHGEEKKAALHFLRNAAARNEINPVDSWIERQQTTNGVSEFAAMHPVSSPEQHPVSSATMANKSHTPNPQQIQSKAARH